VRVECMLQVAHFLGHQERAAPPEVVAPDRLGAPVAVERATPRGIHVEAEVSVALTPHRPVALDVDQMPSRLAGQLRVRRLYADPDRLQLPVFEEGNAGHSA